MRDIVEIMKSFKEIRKASNVSVAKVADYIQKVSGNKISPKTIYGWEEGHAKPDIMSFIAMCDLYEVGDVRELFARDIQNNNKTIRDELYKSYISNPDVQLAIRKLLGLE